MGTNIEGGVTAKGVVLVPQNCRGLMLKMAMAKGKGSVEFQKVISVNKSRLTLILAGT